MIIVMGGVGMKKSALLFPGQGSQYVSMGESNYNNYAFVREIWEEANDILQFDILKLCLEGPKQKLMQTDLTQPALFVVQYAAYHVLLHRSDFAIDYFAGHSLGEISALACVGAIEFRDALNIVRARGQLMNESSNDMQGRMVAIRGLNESELTELCIRFTDSDGEVVIACKNTPNQYVISGSVKSVEKVVGYVERYKGHAIDLDVSNAFHSPYMKSAAHRFEQVLKQYIYNEPKGTVISNVTAAPYKDESEIVNNLVMQLTHPVEWINTLKYLLGKGVQLFIDIGPGRVLKDLAGRNDLLGEVYAIDTPEDYNTLLEAVSEKSDREVIERCIAIAISTKNRTWHSKMYEEQVVQPIAELRSLLEARETSGHQYKKGNRNQAIQLLRTCLEGKQIPLQEQVELLSTIE